LQGGIQLYLFADYHTHSQYSHGRGDLEGNIRTARARGLEELAITDHGPALAFNLGVRRAEELLEIKGKIGRLQEKYPEVRVLAGVEANVINSNGDLDVPGEILDQLDIVLAGLHPNIFPRTFENFRLLALYWGGKLSGYLGQRSRLFNTRALVNAVERYPIAIVTHPGLKLAVDTRELARACAACGTALEINSSHGYLTAAFVSVAAAEGVKFAINSDAHHPWAVGDLGPGLAVARQAGLTAAEIINARELPPRGFPTSPGL
jgi:putative hydrolase